MIFQNFFKKTLFISLLGHITVFSIFSFSFGNKIHKTDYVSVSFWGQLLRNSQVNQSAITPIRDSSPHFFSKPDILVLDRLDTRSQLTADNWWNKPPLSLSFIPEKKVFSQTPKTILRSSPRQEPEIIFYPLLPYSFILYFKDRQVAHVELMFKIVSADSRDFIVIKRKISSGNLEVDLLTMRYIGHYLFIQKPLSTPDTWQTVKIDLTGSQ